MVRSMENEDPPPVSVASPIRSCGASDILNNPDPMKVFDVGQCTNAAPISVRRDFSRRVK